MEKINTVPSFSRQAALFAGATVGLGNVAVGDVSAAEGLTAPLSEAVTMLDVVSGAGSADTIERKGQIVLIGLDRPSAKNRVGPPTQYALARAYYDDEHDPSLRAAVLFGFAKLPVQRAALDRTQDFLEGLLSRKEKRAPIYSND